MGYSKFVTIIWAYIVNVLTSAIILVLYVNTSILLLQHGSALLSVLMYIVTGWLQFNINETTNFCFIDLITPAIMYAITVKVLIALYNLWFYRLTAITRGGCIV